VKQIQENDNKLKNDPIVTDRFKRANELAEKKRQRKQELQAKLAALSEKQQELAKAREASVEVLQKFKNIQETNKIQIIDLNSSKAKNNIQSNAKIA